MILFENGDKVLFTGDSVTDSNRGRPVGEGLWEGVGNGYVRSIDTMLNVCYPELLIHVANTGINGNTSSDLAARFDKDVLDLKPDYLVILIGTNDVWRFFDSPAVTNQQVGADKYRENLIEMIEKSKDKVKKIILMTPYYMDTNKQDPMRMKMDEYGAIMKAVAAEYSLDCIDLQSEFDEYLKYRHSSFLTWDKVHPGWIGSLIIAKRFLKQVGFDRPVV